jgi:hypothetical protein
MDGGIFDRWTRGLARRTSRRRAVGVAGAGAAVVAVSPAGRALAQDVDAIVVCRLDFEATVRIGPSSEDEDFTTIAGVLRLPVAARGGIDGGELAVDGGIDDGEIYAVGGQTSGRAVNLRIDVGRRDAIVAVGVGEQSLRACAGEYGGPATGPERGDLGDWRAVAIGLEDATPTPLATAASGGGDTGSGPQPTMPPPTACPPQACVDPLQWDPIACECSCNWLGAGHVACGGVCCPPGFVCLTDGSCMCPAGTEFCGDTCVTACPQGQQMNYGTCSCDPA